ncbi:MAG: DUF937 domain-containing protein [Bacteroidetes bacterium]|nr:DUF937 domain-containing protein [Bacteroidota bacterium]
MCTFEENQFLMFDNLLKLVQEHAGEAIINNPAIPNEKNNAAIGAATEGIMDHLKNLGANGGLDSIMGIFQGGNAASSPEVSNIAGSVAGKLMSNFGIDAEQAQNIVGKLVPQVMEKFVNKTNDPNDSSFDLQDILGSVTGNGGGLGDILGKVKGLF